MYLRKIKSFISYFIIIFVLLAIILPNFYSDEYLAATAVTSTTERKRQKTVGHKIEGAEYYDELWDKFSVIAIDNGGGNGEGGGAGDQNALNAGNSGTYQDAGGTFGNAAGQGLGTGNVSNQSGNGAGTIGGSTGSAVADAFRALRTQIEESRAESIRRVIETAANAESVAASIAERESIQSSIQKRIQQESIKAKIVQAETQRQYETPVYVVETARQRETLEIKTETISPTSGERILYITDEKTIPTSRFVQLVQFNETQIEPTPVYEEEFNPLTEVKRVTISDYEPGDFVTATQAKNVITYNLEQTIERPTSDTLEETIPETTLEVFDSPIIEEETTIVETSPTEESKDADEKDDVSDVEEGKGSKGGDDAEKEEDMSGDDGENESEGNADNRGQHHLETEGEYVGKKIFELDQNGNFGLDAQHLSVTNMRGLLTAVITLLLLLGALVFVLGNKDKYKINNYF